MRGIASLFLAPVGLLYVAKDYPYESGNVFFFNGILWSLFFAVAASAVYGTRVRKLPGGVLITCFVLCSAAWVAASIWAGSVADLGRHGLIGQITAENGSTWTINARSGTQYTVTITPQTQFGTRRMPGQTFG